MAFWSRLISALRKTNEPQYPNQRYIPYSGRTQAGVFITPDRALMNGTVWAAHRYLTQSVAQLPARIIRKTPNGNKTIDTHPVDSVLNWRVNPELSPFQFKETMVGWAILWGNAVAEIERDAVGRVVNLWPIHPRRVSFRRDLDSGEIIYKVNNQFGSGLGQTGSSVGSVDLRPQDVFHLRGYGDSPVGLSVIEYAAQSIGWARATELFSASWYGEGMHFGGSAVLPGKADDEAINKIRTELEQSYKGPGRAGKWFIGDGDLKLQPLVPSARDAQFVSTMQHQVEEICRWMGVPPHKVHHLLRMTFNNVEQMSIDVVGDSIVPWAMRLEQEATYKLFGLNRSNLCVVFEVKGLLRGDQKSRQESLQIQRRNGVINADDWAEIEDIPRPRTGGQIYIVEGNMTELTKDGLASENQEPTPATEPSTNPEPIPAPDNTNALFTLAEAASLLDERESVI